MLYSGENVNVVCNGGYNSLESENAQKQKTFERILALFNVKDDSLSVRPCTDGLKNSMHLYMSKKSEI